MKCSDTIGCGTMCDGTRGADAARMLVDVRSMEISNSIADLMLCMQQSRRVAVTGGAGLEESIRIARNKFEAIERAVRGLHRERGERRVEPVDAAGGGAGGAGLDVMG